MFSRAKRFDYYPQPETPSPPCRRHAKKHPTSTPKLSKKNSKTPEMTQLLEQLEQAGRRIQNRCDTIDDLCRDYLSLDDGFFSTRSSSPEAVASTPAFEDSVVPEGFDSLAQFYAETVAELVCKKLDERDKARSVWKKAKQLYKSVRGETIWDIFCPKIIEGQF
ncbi:uncharacterized protein LOC123005512 [Tribolium madens]|uniref:uncharacterized protein LOC123005512 n=1 Tax=Tribolium madens TaxID=41895 RepID=UPI001CF7269A|nr:uncharacterized protein LOC123005512 [Tribolium madens]